MRSHFRTLSIFLLVLMNALLTSPMGIGKSKASAQRKPELSTKRDPAQARQRLERLVRHELVMLPYYSVFDNLAFKVEGSRVELLGQVSRPTLKSDSERVVKNIEGVESVTNKIEVLPVSPNDDRIRLAVYRAIYGHTALQRYGLQAVPPIHIIVKNGNVTLVGVVNNQVDRAKAEADARFAATFFALTNDLRVERG